MERNTISDVKLDTELDRKNRIKDLERQLIDNKLERLKLEFEEDQLREQIIEIEKVDRPIKAFTNSAVKTVKWIWRYLVH